MLAILPKTGSFLVSVLGAVVRSNVSGFCGARYGLVFKDFLFSTLPAKFILKVQIEQVLYFYVLPIF